MYTLIDPPITPYSTKEEIQKWINELKKMKQTPEVLKAIVSAKEIGELLGQGSIDRCDASPVFPDH